MSSGTHVCFSFGLEKGWLGSLNLVVDHLVLGTGSGQARILDTEEVWPYQYRECHCFVWALGKDLL